MRSPFKAYILKYYQCRSQHAKCGAEMPNCSRCLQDGKSCVYVQSRRSTNRNSVALPVSILDEANHTLPTSTVAHESSVQENDCVPGEYEVLSLTLPIEAMNSSYSEESDREFDHKFLDAYYWYGYITTFNEVYRH
jgi:hypothetical protein